MSRLNLDLEMIGVRVGDTLTFVNDDTVTCIVVETYRPRVYFGARS